MRRFATGCCLSRFTRRFTNWRLLCPARKSNCPVNQNVCQRSLNVRQIPEIGRSSQLGHRFVRLHYRLHLPALFLESRFRFRCSSPLSTHTCTHMGTYAHVSAPNSWTKSRKPFWSLCFSRYSYVHKKQRNNRSREQECVVENNCLIYAFTANPGPVCSRRSSAPFLHDSNRLKL